MKKRQVVLYIVVMLIMLTTSVYATVSAELSVNIKGKSDKFYAGDEFTVTVGLKDINTEKGIKSVEGYLDIDKNVIEDLTVSSIVTDSDGKVKVDEKNLLPVYDASKISSSDTGIFLNTNPVSKKGDYKLVINLTEAVTGSVDLLTLKLKIKSGVAAGNYSSVMNYKLFTIFEDDAGEKFEIATKAYKLEVSEGSGSSSDDNKNDTTNTPKNDTANNVVNNTERKPVNNVVNNTQNETQDDVNRKPVNPTNPGDGGATGNPSKQDSTVAPTNLPKTGYRLILLPIIAVAIVGFVFYKKYSKYNYHE